MHTVKNDFTRIHYSDGKRRIVRCIIKRDFIEDDEKFWIEDISTGKVEGIDKNKYRELINRILKSMNIKNMVSYNHHETIKYSNGYEYVKYKNGNSDD